MLCLARSGQVELAVNRTKVRLDEARQRSEWKLVCETLFVLGEMLLEQQEYIRARVYFAEAILIAAKWLPELLSYYWRHQARAATGQSDYPYAWHCLEQALMAAQNNKQPDREGWTQWDMAKLAFQEGNRQKAEAHINACISLFVRLYDVHSIYRCLIELAQFCVTWGQIQRAATLLGCAERAFEEHGFRKSTEDQASFDGLAALIRQSLKAETWQAAWGRGKQMTLNHAAHFVSLVPGFSP